MKPTAFATVNGKWDEVAQKNPLHTFLQNRKPGRSGFAKGFRGNT